MKTQKQLAVVVGATGAFGRQIVARLSASDLDVVAVARSAEALDELVDRHPGLIACVADIASDSAVASIRAALVDAVNIKVGGLLRLVRAVDEHLVKGSRLVAIGGHYGFEPTAYAAAAGVANAALMNAVRQLSLAYGERGMTAHLIAPGPADTERLHRVAADRARQRGISAEAVLREMCAESSLGALTTPAQVAWAVSLLLAPEADAMTGSSLMLDSGRRRGLP